jgi:uncharacterized membrane protein
MVVLTKIGDLFVWLADRIWDTWRLVDSIPLIADPLSSLFDAGYNLCWWLRDEFYQLSAQWDAIETRIGTIVSWETITGALSDTWNRAISQVNEVWNWVRDHVTELWNYVRNNFAELWSYVTAHFAELRSWASGEISALWSSLTNQVADIWRHLADLPHIVGDIIYQWLSDNLFQWLKDRAAQTVNVAGSILEAVW